MRQPRPSGCGPLPEREVKADLALWPVQFAVTADDLTVLQKRAETSEQTIRAFLAKGFAGEAITVSAPRVNDPTLKASSVAQAISRAIPPRSPSRYGPKGSTRVREAIQRSRRARSWSLFAVLDV
ncbi:MAG: hypothetical protein ACT4O5_10015 [Gammaproteobacteria bacterium]